MNRAQPTAAPALWFGALCVFLVAVNLRLPITAVSPVLDQVQRDEGVGSGAASLLVSIPVLCFALLPAAVVRFGRRFGLTSAVLVSLVVMVAGFGLRLVPDQVGLLAGTVVLGVAITAGNVLIPPLIKRDHSGSSGSLTGLYSLGLYFGAALGAGLTVPLQRGTGLDWRSTITLWVVVPLVALAVWVFRARISSGGHRHRSPSGVTPGPATAASPWRHRTAWAVTLVFAIPALIFYAVSAWLPTMLVDETGRDPAAAGAVLAVVNIAAIPAALVVGIAANRTRRQTWLTVFTGLLLAVGIVGFLVVPAAALTWAVLLGVGLGGGTTLGYALPLLRSSGTAAAARLTAMAQTAGFLLCAIGPVAVGLLHDLTHEWSAGMVVLALLTAVYIVAGFDAGRDVSI
ncbi:MFS transporter [Brachybacterium sacelli]|uniref:MFS transporter, CP family, cyanate transporter n=2 Tax=Micrococcales TaxID=85006 RepID=A0A1H1RTA2_BRESA|nr:MFS transporter [Brachybacterium sacelli]MBP2383670.1 CP family cyanate transporter-like MFS transporter [Brachybacterium sacelli]SDS38967.1 MFS transporter, CP family, cyanate transporter [Brevibacterium sandarakinum]